MCAQRNVYIQYCLQVQTGKMGLPCLGANQKYVIVFIFYSAKTVKFSFNTLALYAIQLYEDKNGMSDH